MLAMTRPAGLRAAGFTLIELMMVVALLGIAATLAAPDLRRTIKNQEISNAASDLLSAALSARAAALKNNARTVLQPIGGSGASWKDGWRVYIDADRNSKFEAAKDTVVLVRESPLPADTAITGTVLAQIAFDPDGFLANIAANSTNNVSASYNGRITIGSSAAGVTRQRVLIVARTGQSRICASETAAEATANCPTTQSN